MPIATIRAIGDGLYHIHVLEGRTDPGYGQGGGFRPDNELPGGGHISNRPPGSWEGRPDNSLPNHPHFPNNSLPSGPPPHVPAGATLVLVRDPAGVWHYAAIQPGQPVPPPLPGQPLPPTAAPKPA